jgi:plastocyanin
MHKLVRPAIVTFGVIALAFGLFTTAPASVSAATTSVAVGNFYFCSASFQGGTCPTTINVGDTVVWNFASATATHTTTSDTGVWDSGNVNPGGSYSHTFTQAGSFPYHCNVHPTQMKGTVIVQAAGASPTSAPVGQTPATGATVAPASGSLPGSGMGPPQPSSTNWWVLGALLGGGVALTGAGFAYTRRTRGV